MSGLFKKILMVLAVYLVLLVSLHAMGGLSKIVHGDDQMNGNQRLYEHISSLPVVIE